ncbi:MAG: c-type cytochrome [Alphaproteobacteria bacterium]|nr:c-type cytochrome [Alphaproteobacteria bacterium]
MLAKTLGVAAAALLAFSASSLAADIAAGKRVAVRCASCHSFAEGKNELGPSLFGVVGRKAGAMANFAYSPAMKNSAIVWTADNLDAYLGGPKALVLGNHMGYQGVTKEGDRADLIAYLATLK